MLLPLRWDGSGSAHGACSVVACVQNALRDDGGEAASCIRYGEEAHDVTPLSLVSNDSKHSLAPPRADAVITGLRQLSGDRNAICGTGATGMQC